MEIFPHWKGSNTILNVSVHSVTSLSRWTDYSLNTTTMERIRPFGLVKKKIIKSDFDPWEDPTCRRLQPKNQTKQIINWTTQMSKCCQCSLGVCIWPIYHHFQPPIPRWLTDKESVCQCGRGRRHRFHPWVRKILGGGNGTPLQYSCLENSMDRGAGGLVHGVAKSWTWLRIHAHIPRY